MIRTPKDLKMKHQFQKYSCIRICFFLSKPFGALIFAQLSRSIHLRNYYQHSEQSDSKFQDCRCNVILEKKSAQHQLLQNDLKGKVMICFLLFLHELRKKKDQL